jgi:hypothetical protein
MYHVFTRSWWKIVKGQYGQTSRVPYMGRKTTLAHVNTEQQARAICKQYNESHNPGPTSRKAEYTQE